MSEILVVLQTMPFLIMFLKTKSSMIFTIITNKTYFIMVQDISALSQKEPRRLISPTHSIKSSNCVISVNNYIHSRLHNRDALSMKTFNVIANLLWKLFLWKRREKNTDNQYYNLLYKIYNYVYYLSRQIMKLFKWLFLLVSDDFYNMPTILKIFIRKTSNIQIFLSLWVRKVFS